MFYTYRQNNSGGGFHFDHKRGISVNVIIEATSKRVANARAEDIGIYFNGCAMGLDCDCCGDRWTEPWGDGTDTPQVYDQDVSSGVYAERDARWSKDGIETYIHYLDGRVVPVRHAR